MPGSTNGWKDVSFVGAGADAGAGVSMRGGEDERRGGEDERDGALLM
jgi:hypothetical protein